MKAKENTSLGQLCFQTAHLQSQVNDCGNLLSNKAKMLLIKNTENSDKYL